MTTTGAGRPLDEPGQGVSPAATVVKGSFGIVGGTFDPIHVGHLAAAEEAREALGLERVVFMPAGMPPHKAGQVVSAAADRLAMVALAIAGNPAFELSEMEVERPGPSYTVDTVDRLVHDERAAGREPNITLILSVESFRDLPSWHEPERLLGLCRLAVIPRGGFPSPGKAWLEEHLPGLSAEAVFLDRPRLRLSATDIRERVVAGRSIRYLVPDAVIAYIDDHGLYRRASASRPPSTKQTTGGKSTS